MSQNQPPFQPQQQPKPKKPLMKKWWFWLIVAVVLLGLLSRCGGGSDQATPETTPAPAPATTTTEAPAPTTEAPAPTQEPEPAGPTAEELEAYVANGAGAKTYDEACINGLSWMCDIESVDIHGDNTIQVNVRDHGAVDGDRRARNFFNFISEQGGVKRTDSPMPKLTHVQVVSNTGGKNGRYLHGID